MLKKTTAAVLTLLLSFCVSACTPASETDTAAPSDATTTSTSGTTSSPTTTPHASAFPEIVLVDSEDVVIKITGADSNSLFGYTLKVYLENKTDKDLMFTVDNVSVNGFMCDPFWAESVAARKKSNSAVSWLKSSFEDNSIENVEEITFTLRVYDSNDILAEDLLEKSFTINP